MPDFSHYLSVGVYELCPESPVAETCFTLANFLQPINGFGVSKVVLSNNPNFKEGDYVTSFANWEEYSFIPGGQQLKVVDPSLAPLSYHLGCLGKHHLDFPSMYLFYYARQLSSGLLSQLQCFQVLI